LLFPKKDKKMEYSEINKLSPNEYLNWEKFKTEHEIGSNIDIVDKAYKEGLKYSEQADAIFIGENGVWSADLKGGSYVSSYEVIGYHACSAWKLKGFLDGPASLIVYRKGKRIRIK